MPRRLPRCANCGDSLTGQAGTVIVDCPDVPGRPAIGWHLGECAKTDLVFRQFIKETRPTIEVFKIVEERGNGRFVANKAWYKD